MSSPVAQPRTRLPRFAEAAAQRARLSVVPRGQVRAARVPFVTLVSVLLVGGVVGLLLFNTSMQQASFATTALEGQSSALAAREQTLRMELDDLRDPQRVALDARRQGMVPAATAAFLRLADGAVLGTAVPASAADGLRLRPLPPRKPAALIPRRTVVRVPPPANSPADTAAASVGDAAETGRNGRGGSR